MDVIEAEIYFLPKAMWSSMVDVKAGGQTLWRVNAMTNQVLGIQILRDNGQDQIIRSGNCYCSSISVASIDENKNTAIERLPWIPLKTLIRNRIALRTGKKKCTSCKVWSPAPSVPKISYSAQTKKKKKNITKMPTYNTNIDIQS